jgi:hypothetical protein
VTNHAEPTIDQLEVGLRARLQVGPDQRLASTIDARVERALLVAPSAAMRRSRRRVPLALAAALALAGFVAGAVLAERVWGPDEVRGFPGLTNFGQPFWNTPLYELPPDEAHQLVVERGYAIIWQVEDRGGTVDSADDSSRFTEIAPTCGSVEGGALFDGVVHMVVLIDDPNFPESAC